MQKNMDTNLNMRGAIYLKEKTYLKDSFLSFMR